MHCLPHLLRVNLECPPLRALAALLVRWINLLILYFYFIYVQLLTPYIVLYHIVALRILMHVQTCKLASAPSAAVSSRAPNSLVYNESHIGRLVEVNMPPKLLKGKLVFVGPHAKDGAPRCGVFLSAPDGINNGTVGVHIFRMPR